MNTREDLDVLIHRKKWRSQNCSSRKDNAPADVEMKQSWPHINPNNANHINHAVPDGVKQSSTDVCRKSVVSWMSALRVENLAWLQSRLIGSTDLCFCHAPTNSTCSSQKLAEQLAIAKDQSGSQQPLQRL